MKLKLTSLVFLIFMLNFTHAQVKFRVKKMNADSLASLIPEKEGIEKIDVLNLLSNVICRKDIDSSINLASQAIELSEKLEYQKGLADGYFNAGNGYFLLDSLQPTISNYLKALRIYEDLEPSEEYGNLCMQLYLINLFTRRLESSFQYGKRAISIYDKINDTAGMAMANFGCGIGGYIYEWDTAIYYCNTATSLFDPKTDQNEIAYVYNALGETYQNKYFESHDTSYLTTALFWIFKALDQPKIYDEVKTMIYFNVGKSYLMYNTDEDIHTAIEYLQLANYLSDSCFDAYDWKSIIYYLLGLASNSLGDNNKAIFFYKEGIKTIEHRLPDFSIIDYKEPVLGLNFKRHHKRYKQLICTGLYNTYYELGNYKKALEFYTLSKEAEQNTYHEKYQNMFTMLESISEDEKKEKQMALLTKDNKLQELTIKQSRTYLFALAGFILILVLVALLFFRQRKIRAEHKTFIREQKLLHDLELKNVESEKLKELDHLKSRFFANISHEFRTPLTLIKGPLEKVLSNPEDKNILKELGVAKKYTGKLQILINNLLTISKLESGKMELHTSEVDIAKLVGTYIQSFESLAKQKSIALKFEAKQEIKAFIDREKFEQVLNNLLSNAFKFTGEGGKIKVEITPQPPSRGDIPPTTFSPLEGGQRGVTIKISDTGRGIPPEHINHVFDRFYQVAQEENSYYKGTGIGLALTKELVELHHGIIKVESEPGKGSTFTILLPLGKEHLNKNEIVDQNESSKFEVRGSNTESQIADIVESEFTEVDLTRNRQHQASLPSRQASSNQQPILLIVEDNADMRAYIKGYFENEFQIVEAIDGADGYKKSTDFIPDIIISDVMMPRMDGVEFCKKVKTDERTSHIPVILLTARASKESRLEGLETGADDFITKPFDGDELQVRVNNLIDQRKRLSIVLEKKFQKIHSTADLSFEDIGITSMDDKFLQKAKEVVTESLSNPDYSIEDFASAMALSRSQLHRKLKALINNSGTEFIRTIRLNYASGLLRKKIGTISEIAYDAGFNSPAYFSQLFRQAFGKSPSDYQNSFED